MKDSNDKRKDPSLPTVGELLTNVISMSNISQRELAINLGYKAHHSNIVSMWKKGKRVPKHQIYDLAIELNIDPVYLFRVADNEYGDDLMPIFEKLFGGFAPTGNEVKILNIVREALGGHDAAPRTKAQEKELKSAIAKLAKDW